MGRQIKVNWTQVYELGKRTSDNVMEFELIRERMLKNVEEIKKCWQGADAENFINNYSRYLENLKEEVLYLNEWSEYFKKSSGRYNDQVDDGYRKIQIMNEEFEMKKEPEFMEEY